MSVSKGLARLGRQKSAAPGLSLESADGWFPVGRRRELTADAAMKISAVSACVEIISNAIGMLPVYVMDSGSKARLGDHPLGRVLWERTNEAMSPFVFFRLAECQRLLRGNAYAWIYRDGYGEPVELIPLPPSTCEPVIEPGTGRLWYLAAEPKSGRMYKLSPADILHFKAYSPDGIKGVSVLRRARQTLEIASAAQRYEQALYENGGRPSGILKAATDLGGTTTLPDGTEISMKDYIRREWDKIHAGPGNGFRTAVLDLGMEYQAISMNNSDAQFVQNKAVTIADIARFFGVPLYKLGEGHQAFNSNEQNNIEFCVNTIQPIITQMEFEETGKLLTIGDRRRGLEVRHNMMALLRGDSASRMNVYRTLREIGVYSPNDICALEDLPPVPGGDSRYASFNYGPLEDWAELSRARAVRSASDEKAMALEEKLDHILRLCEKGAVHSGKHHKGRGGSEGRAHSGRHGAHQRPEPPGTEGGGDLHLPGGGGGYPGGPGF